MSAAHRHAAGIWCDDCPDAEEKRAALAAENALRNATRAATSIHAMTLRLNEPLWLRLRQAAHDERRSISDLIRDAVEARHPAQPTAPSPVAPSTEGGESRG